jgi:hypothetical protein
MKVLVGCEFSGTVRDAFAKLGHDAWSCDLLAAGGKHIQGDVLKILDDGWDLAVFHPPCTYLSSSGLHWNKRRPERARLTEEAIEFARQLLAAPIHYIALENPVGCLSSQIRKPDQIIQPYWFGHDASKATCLWLKDLPKLRPTKFVEPRMVGGKPRWANQTDSGQNKLGPSKDRWALRSITYSGIAEAMATQWTDYHNEWLTIQEGRAYNI